ncbi:MAG: hypothetical protein HY875_06700 [Chloroflexi bacterium]|nr:hypothetical protein [Chloroflexota bacterium]
MSESPPGTEPAPFASRNSDLSDMEAIQEFIDEAVVTEVLNVVKSGKEATVYRCRAHRSVGHKFVAAKVYHDSAFRNFGRDSSYTEGRVILVGQVRRAVEKKTDVGRKLGASIWVNHEFEVLSELHYAGADVPEPFFSTDRAILMEYVGGADEGGIQLQHARLEPDEAGPALERLLWNIETFLDHHIVHADLSPFNVLTLDGKLKVIDFPQAVDPRQNRGWLTLLERDLRNICRHFDRYGFSEDWQRIAANLERRYRLGELG